MTEAHAGGPGGWDPAHKEPVALYGWRNRLRNVGMRAIGARQLHVLGCPGLGLSRIHAALAAFDGCVVVDRDLGAVGGRGGRTSGPSVLDALQARRRWLVTRCGGGWTRDAAVAYLVERARRERIALIHVVADPRVPTTSDDASQARRAALQHWAQCVRAASIALEAVDGFAPTLTLRYDRVLGDPGPARARVAAAFGLDPGRENTWTHALRGSDPAPSWTDPLAPEDPRAGVATSLPASVSELESQRRIEAYLEEFGYG